MAPEVVLVIVAGAPTGIGMTNQPNRAVTPRSRVPLEPLATAVEHQGGFALLCRRAASGDPTSSQRLLWQLRRAWSRGRQHGVLTPQAADLLAVKLLATHPMLIWPSWDSLDVYQPSRRDVHRTGRAAA